MLNIGISVEGETEYFFVKFVLARYLLNFDIVLAEPVILGGNVTFSRIEHALNILSNNYDYVTTLYDFYGFADKSSIDNYHTLVDRIVNLTAIKHKNNIIPYIQMYEFEALLLSDLNILASYMSDNSEVVDNYKLKLEQNIGDKKPEEVNDSLYTAPSKRIKNIFRKYKKTLYGYVVAQEIGIDNIRQHCHNFNLWIEALIKLSQSNFYDNML